jgi:hypothetical protein
VWNRCSKPPASRHRLVARHRKARLAVEGPLTLVRRIEQGRPIALGAHVMGTSRTTPHRWWSRWLAEGEPGLHGRPSLALRPHRTDERLEAWVVRLRRQHKWGPAPIAPQVGLPVSTVQRILLRHGVTGSPRWTGRPAASCAATNGPSRASWCTWT